MEPFHQNKEPAGKTYALPTTILQNVQTFKTMQEIERPKQKNEESYGNCIRDNQDQQDQ